MLAAAVLLFMAFGTMDIDRIVRSAAAASVVPPVAEVAVLLIACAALLKCAQLPFHGWLIQVMEAPTPVSALLHAGVVNLGGFVLIRFAPLVDQVAAAGVLLVLVGTSTAVLAALVMTTRISVKVSLAWSTCAQMGFMLMQCGLGLWQMALVHLLAHSLYKAHAFLSAGAVVRRTMVSQLAVPEAAPGPLRMMAGFLFGLGITLVAGVAFGALATPQGVQPIVWVMAGIVALALVPLVQLSSLQRGRLWLPGLVLGGLGVALASFGLHALFGLWLRPASSVTAAGGSSLWLFVALAFGSLFLLQSLIRVMPQSRLARSLYPWFYGGLFLDEKFNQLAFRLWPPPAPARADALLPVTDAHAAVPTPVANPLGAPS
jgi:NAD(P)H-quinone oxidoreductase subunit 5